MYKKIAAVLTLCLLLTACAGTTPASSTVGPTTATATADATTTATTAAAPTSSSEDAPLEGELKALYDRALVRMNQIRFSDVVLTKEYQKADGLIYTRVAEPDFGTMAELRAYLGECFTEAFIDSTLLPPQQTVWREFDGALYLLEVGKGSNILYAGHVLTLDSRTDDEIRITARCYYAKEMEDVPAQPFYTAPADAAAFDTEDKPLTLQKTADGWRFSQFPIYF